CLMRFSRLTCFTRGVGVSRVGLSVTKAEKWSAARGEMLLDPTVTNLNTGSFGPLPRVVFERVTALRQRLAAAPMDFLLRQAPPAAAGTRAPGGISWRRAAAAYVHGQRHGGDQSNRGWADSCCARRNLDDRS